MKDSTATTAPTKLSDLLARMTPEEKAAQLSGVWLKDLVRDNRLDLHACRERIPHGIGHVSQFGSCTTLRPDELAACVAQLQAWLKRETRMGIPAMFHEETITGMAVRGATTYPQQIGMSCTWNADLIRENSRATARSMRSVGACHCLSPMLDIIDNANWSRLEEGFGEDPYLASELGLAFIQGIQGDDSQTGDGQQTGIAATTKHFAGYGAANDNLSTFLTDTLMPHEVAVRVGNVAAVMPGYHAFDHVPCTVSPFLLTDILRSRWGFDGLLVADYNAITQVHTKFAYAKPGETPGPESTTRLCFDVQTDVEFPEQRVFFSIPKLLLEGRLSEAAVNRSVLRVLKLKQSQGLLDAPAATGHVAPLDLDPPDNRARAYAAACQSVVLLQNDNILPLRTEGPNAIRSIALVGPQSDSFYSLLGDYTYQTMAEFWWRHPVDPAVPRLVTLAKGLADGLPPGVSLQHERGCDWTAPLDGPFGIPAASQTTADGDQRIHESKKFPLEVHPAPNLDRALRIADESDVIIAAVGETRYQCGESVNRQGLALPGEQEQFVERLLDTDKPVVLVVFGGRPMTLARLAARCRAILYAWYPGQSGGTAIADILFGRVNPSGKLTVTLPRSPEQVPTSYRRGYDHSNPPLFPFGHGLGYTAFTYSSLSCPSTVRASDESFEVAFEVTNTGSVAGVEIAQVYLIPKSPAAKRPAQEIKGYQRVALNPGETRPVRLRLFTHQFARYESVDSLLISPGAFDLAIGSSSTDLRLCAPLQITGDPVPLPRREHFFSQAVNS